MEIYPVVRKSLAYANRAPRPHLHSNLWVSSPFSPSQYSLAYILFLFPGVWEAGGGQAPCWGRLTAANSRQVANPRGAQQSTDMSGRQPAPLW